MGSTLADACNNMLLFGLLFALVAISISNIIVIALNEGDKDLLSVGFADGLYVRGTLELSRVESEVRMHVILSSTFPGAVTNVSIHGPTGDFPMVADPGPEIVRVCGAPASACSQTGLVIQSRSQEVMNGGSIRSALEAIRTNPHRFWIQVDSFNTTALVVVPLSA